MSILPAATVNPINDQKVGATETTEKFKWDSYYTSHRVKSLLS